MFLFLACVSSRKNPPTDIILSNNNVREDAVVNSIIGNLSTIDPNINDIFIYTIITDTDNKFNIVSNTLRLKNTLDYETKISHNVTIRSTDNKGKYFDKVFTINILNVSDTVDAFYLLLENSDRLLKQNNEKIILY